jgi:hypothetical protein
MTALVVNGEIEQRGPHAVLWRTLNDGQAAGHRLRAQAGQRASRAHGGIPPRFLPVPAGILSTQA